MDAVTEACAIRNLEECFGKASRHQAILDWPQASGKRESIPANRKPLPPCCLCLSKGLAEAYQAELQICLVGFLATRPFGAKLAPLGTGVPKEAKDLVDGAPKMVKEGASKAEAEDIKAKLEAEGAKVTLK